MKKKAVIIGAGPAGLTAAYELLKRGGFTVTVIESSDSAGGLCRCGDLDGNLCDPGGHRFFTDDERAEKLWKELLGDELTVRERHSSVYFKGKLFDYPVTEKIFSQLGFTLTARSALSLLGTAFSKQSEKDLEGYLINRFGKTLYGIFFKEYTRKLWGRPPCEISPDWGKQRIKGITIKEAASVPFKKKVHKPSEFFYPRYGPGQMWQSAAEKITAMGGEILLNSTVTGFSSDDRGITAAEYLSDGITHSIEGDLFLSSMPLKDLILSVDSASEKLKETARDLHFRSHITVGILAEKLSVQYGKSCWIYIQDPSVRLGRVQFYSNWSPCLLKDSSKQWIGAEFFSDENDDFFRLSDRELTDIAVKELVETGILDSADDVCKSIVMKAEKAYPAYWGSYESIGALREFADSFGNLYCIGRNGQHRYNNISHAMLTSLEAVDNITAGISSKENVWAVNSQESFQENN